MQFPVTARHKGREIQVKLNATEDIMHTMEAGLRDDVNITLVAAKQDFGDLLPKTMDAFHLQLSGHWVKFMVRNVPDYFDPLSPGITINLQSEKGVE